MMLAALGVVYGDIGTSPLYALKEIFNPARGLTLDHDTLTGALSLIFWSLMFVVSLKYVTLILRANNRGRAASWRCWPWPPVRWASAAACGDCSPRWASSARRSSMAMRCSPAISVLSAVEGLEVATPVFAPYIVPLTVVIITVLFAFQRWGTAGIGGGLRSGDGALVRHPRLHRDIAAILRHPEVLSALDPFKGISFLRHHGFTGFASLGAVVLALTGAEAFYADMGHFGVRPIRLAWFWLVLPALALNYSRTRAHCCWPNRRPSRTPSSRCAPDWALLPAGGAGDAGHGDRLAGD
jgi:KUP system potassium uptake protein